MSRFRDVLGAAVLASAALLGSCGAGNNETPASFDPVELALVRVEPGDGESAVPRNRPVRLIFNTTVLPESVTDQSIKVRGGGTFQTRPEGTFIISGNIVEFEPTVTVDGGPHGIGFDAGAQILVDVPLLLPGDNRPANDFVQNVEGNPVTAASADNKIVFTTGCGWDDKIPGPPGALRLEFTPSPNAAGQVPPNAAVTVVFSEAIDPSSVILGKNLFLTNNTDTSPDFQLDIPSITFFDGSLTRFTFQPVFGFGQGPFNIKVNFIDPDAPDTFSPDALPTDLAGNQIQNFTFVSTFDTQFDPNAINAGMISEDFTTTAQLDAPNTTASWGVDPMAPFTLVGQPITTRVQNVNVVNILANGGITGIPDPGTGPVDEGRMCGIVFPLLGADFTLSQGFPASSRGRRQMQIYRRAELGGPGTVIRAAWGPLDDQTFASRHDRVVLRFGHKKAGTNLTPEGFFAEFDVDGFTTVADTDYNISANTDVNGGLPNDGYYDWPDFDLFFDYNGADDLIFDVEVTEGVATQRVRTFVGVGPCSCAGLLQPLSPCTYNNSIGLRQKNSVFFGNVPVPSTTVNNYVNPGPYATIMQFEFANLTSIGTSRYYDTGTPDPDYLEPILGPKVQPCGAVIEVRYSGSLDGIVEDVPFTPNVNAVDGFRFIRFQATLRSNIFTGTRARIELIQLPFVLP